MEIKVSQGKDCRCDGLSRRSFLRAGTLALGGLSLADLLRSEAHASGDKGQGKGLSVILLWQGGGPSHMDMWDLKPQAPSEFRGSFNPIRSNLNGYQVSEHMPRTAMVCDKLAILRRMSATEVADVLGNSIRIHQPTYDAVGRRNDDQSKALRKAYSRKALNALKEPADTAMTLPGVNVESLVQGLLYSQDRAGLLVCVDVTSGLNIMLREEGPPNSPRPETTEAIATAVNQRQDVRELMGFAISDELFRLRQRLGVSLA